jgi:hypothetical protein
MRLLTPRRALTAVPLAATLAALLAACGGTADTSAPAPPPLRSLASVASATEAAATGRFSLELTLAADGKTAGFTGTGAFDERANRASFEMNLGDFAASLGGLSGVSGSDDWKIAVVQSGNALYMRIPLASENLPEGVDWVRIDPASIKRAGGSLDQIGSLGSTDPRAFLETLSAVSGGIEVVGREEVRGDVATRYRATLDPAKLQRVFAGQAQARTGQGLSELTGELFSQLGVASIPLEVWVGHDGLVRRMTLALSAQPQGTSGTMSMTVALELYDYGEDVSIDVPLPGEFADAAQLGLTP